MHKHVDNRVTKCRNMLNGVEYAFVVVIAVSTSVYITKWSKVENV